MKNLFRLMLMFSLLIFGCGGDKDTPSLGNVLATIAGINPIQVSIGQKGARGTITGNNFNGVTAVTLGEGISVEQFTAVGATQINVKFSVNNNASPGSRIISVTTAAGKAQSSGSLFSVINNRAPVAAFNVDPPAGSKAIQLTFDGSPSRDPDGSVKQYRWDFGDGSSDNGRIVKKKFSDIGTYEVTLTVKDNKEGSSASSKDIEILANSPPVARIEVKPGAAGYTSSPFFFDGKDSYDPDGRIASFLWNFGDGTRKAQGKEVSHRYREKGNFPVTLVVTDNKGQEGTFSRAIAVREPVEVACSGRGRQDGPDRFIDVISYNRPFAVIRPFGGGNCSTLYYKCGDIRQGGITIKDEKWYGTICRMWDRKDGTYRVHLVRGNSPVQLHVRETYLHAQGCGGGFCGGL